MIKNMPKLSKETLWHHGLGHAPIRKIMTIEGLNIKEEPSDVCLTCPLAKFTELPFVKHLLRAENMFDLVHWGPYKVQYRGKFKYFLTLVDDYSRVTWVHLLELKSDAYDAIKSFAEMVHTQFKRKIKILRSDNALEFDDKRCKTFFENLEIIHQTSCRPLAVIDLIKTGELRGSIKIF